MPSFTDSPAIPVDMPPHMGVDDRLILFGRYEQCALPEADHERRFLGQPGADDQMP